MKNRAWVLTMPVFFAFSAALGHAQTIDTQSPASTRPRTVVTSPQSVPLTPPVPPLGPAVTTPPIPGAATPIFGPAQSAGPQPLLAGATLPTLPKPLAMNDFRSRLTEAERLLKSKPSLTSFRPVGLSTVTLAALEEGSSQIHLITLAKETFLSKGMQVVSTTSLGRLVHVNVLRANGVNTAVAIFDDAGKSYTPLVVEFPIEKFGAVREIAYYTSAHPALLSPEVVRSGQSYVRTMIDLAAKRLKLTGVNIAPNVLDVAEHLCIVEHTDHDRFRKENRINLFQEIYSLYALNELDTYRYSVSFAGAGGMVQMIPSTYQMIRRLHPGAGLNPDFVAGMRNHANALEAMLIYMQDTWNDLLLNPEVTNALSAKIATPAELMAAGYNSNPAKLPLYIRRGGTAWRSLIPRETQMYLQIYQSLDSVVSIKPRTSIPNS
jgi:hypothetical protein